MTTTEFRPRLRDVLNRVEYAEEHVELYRHGRRVAIVVPEMDYLRYLQLDAEAACGKREAP